MWTVMWTYENFENYIFQASGIIKDLYNGISQELFDRIKEWGRKYDLKFVSDLSNTDLG